MGRLHFDGHVWRWVTVPPDLAQAFGAICAHYHWFNSDLIPHEKGNTHLTKLLGRICYQKSRGTITHLHTHTWWARWPRQKILPFNFFIKYWYFPRNSFLNSQLFPTTHFTIVADGAFVSCESVSSTSEWLCCSSLYPLASVNTLTSSDTWRSTAPNH